MRRYETWILQTSPGLYLGLDTDSLQATREKALPPSWDEWFLIWGGGKKEIQLGSRSMAKVRGLHSAFRRDVYAVHTLLTLWLINLRYSLGAAGGIIPM